MHLLYNSNVPRLRFKGFMSDFPSYIKTRSEGRLQEKIAAIEGILSSCTLCPRKCGVDRVQGQLGYCAAPSTLYVSSAFAHYGEEAPLVGTNGSGTIFLTHCNLRCLFCQNCDISIMGEGTAWPPESLASTMLQLQARGCHNINFVTPTHYVLQIVQALDLAAAGGLSIPLVYNCGGYESLEVLRLLDGVIDIYMPDIKFLDPDLSARYCNAADYPERVMDAVREMHRQVGDLEVDASGIARKGLLIRHLVMPGMAENTKKILAFIRHNISSDAFVNIMAQYRPCHQASLHKELNRGITNTEYVEALTFARSIGLTRAGRH